MSPRFFVLVLFALLTASAASAQAHVPSLQRLRVSEDVAAARARYGENHVHVRELIARGRALNGEPSADRARVCAYLAARERTLIAADAELAVRYGDRHERRLEVRLRLRSVRAGRSSVCH